MSTEITPERLDKLLIALYAAYSEDVWCAGWMSASDTQLNYFEDWLAAMLARQPEDYEAELVPRLRESWNKILAQ